MLKPGRHWGFYGVVMVAGWIAPPVACLVRFGVGRDLWLCTILTICGYIPGHVYNFYVQNIRNNNGRGRTPKWAIDHGLVKVKDPKSKPKHQWQNRYDERNPVRADGYQESVGTTSRTESWDGHGPMPPSTADPSAPVKGGKSKKGKQRKGRKHHLEPWNDEVDQDDIQGGPSRRAQHPTETSAHGRGPTDLPEAFYNPPAGASAKPSKFRSIVTGTTSSRHKGDTLTGAHERGAGAGDRFARMDGARVKRGDPADDRRNGTGYHDADAGEEDPWSRSSDAHRSRPVRASDDPLAHHF